MEELRVTIKLDFKDFLNFQYWYLRKRFLTKFIVIGGIILFTNIILPLISGLGLNHLSHFIPSFVIIVFIPAFLILVTYYGAKKNFDNDPQLRKQHNYIFDSAGIQYSADNSHTKMMWTELFKFEESKSNFLIYCSPLKSLIIVKSQLSEHEIITLRELCSLNIKKQAFSSNSVFPVKVRLALIIIPILIGAFIGLYPKKSNENFKEKNKIGYKLLGKKSVYLFGDGYEMVKSGDYENAVSHFDEIILRDSTHFDAYTFRGYSNAMLKNYEDAINDLNKAILIKPDYSTPWYYRGYVKEEMNNITGACVDYLKAKNLGNANAELSVTRLCN